MTYNKPVVLELASAVDAIQTQSAKQQHVVIDTAVKKTSAAYEADE